MSKTVKIILSLILLLLVIVASSIYFISTKINPEMIRKLAVEAIEANLKDSKASIKTVDYSLGTSIDILVQGIKVEQKANNAKLFEFEQLEVKVPLLAILTSGGVIEIQAIAPSVYVKKEGEKLNWLEALQAQADDGKTENSLKPPAKDEKKDIEFPKFVERSKVNFRLKDLKVFLDMGEFQKSTIDVNRITVKNINFVKSSAFEINTSVNFQLDKEKFFHTQIQSIGEIFLKDIIERNLINVSTTLKISESKLDGLPIKIPDIKGKVKVNGNPENLSSLVNLTLENLGSFDSDVNFAGDKLQLSNLKLKVDPQNIIELLGEDIKKSTRIVSFNSSELSVDGEIDFNLKTSAMNPQINFKTTKEISIDLGSPFNVSTGFTGRLIQNDLAVNIESSMLDGKISTQIKTILDPMNIPKEINKLNPIDVMVNLNDLKITRKYLQETLWGPKSPENLSSTINGENSNHVEQEPASQIFFPPVKVKLIGERIHIADQQITLDGNIEIKDNLVTSKHFDMSYGEGKISSVFNLELLSSKDIKSDFNLEFKKVLLEGFNAFFPPYLSDLKGNFVGKVSGNVRIAKILNYNVDAKMRGTDGEMKNLNIAKVLGPLLENIDLLKGKLPKNYNVSNKFEKLYVDTKVSNELIQVNRLEVVGHNKEFDLLANGKVSMLERPSVVTGELFSNLIPKEYQKILGLKKLPFRLRGMGFAIYQPDYAYTNQRLQKAGGKVLKENAKKELKKAEKKVQEAIKVEEKKLKENVKKEEKKIKKKLESEIKNKLKGIKF